MNPLQPRVSAGATDDADVIEDHVVREGEEKSPGVLRMERVASVFTTFDKVLLFGGLFLGACE